MHSTRKFLWAVLLTIPLLASGRALADDVDDYVPEVTDRVARISFLRGDVQIKRDGGQDWERAALNLPIVEGDEITTEGGGRFEIQFNSYTFLRVAENSYLKIETLNDDGIAVSLPQGSLVLRAGEFDQAKTFFEIDAPKTTVSVQKTGMYRIDAGKPDGPEIRVAATDGGEARVYTDSSGFSVKNGRSAKIFLAGNLAGEWEMADAARFADEFDSFALERDAVIAKRMRDAYFDKYYDRDIYGAEDLNDYGEWVYTRKYGYVWRPYRDATSQYSNWSPYRYGQWRWVPPYGWTWVNDEPWGWATYHYGRWVWDDGTWYWTPYGYYRNRRSWWSPALVVLNVINNNVCWYPLPYNYSYFDFNYSYYSHRDRRRRHGNNNYGGGNYGGHNPGGNNPGVVAPTPAPAAPVTGKVLGGRNLGGPPLGNVPANAVIAVAASSFGRDKRAFGTAPPQVAQNVLSSAPDVKKLAVLPTYEDLNGKISQEIRSEKPPMTRAGVIRTGAADRNTDAPLEQELRKAKVFGNRTPIEPNTGREEIRTSGGQFEGPRQTGAVERPPERPKSVRRDPVETPAIRPAPEPAEQEQTRPKAGVNRDIEPVRPPSSESPTKKREEPRYDPPKAEPKREEPRYEPPRQHPEPPPQRSEPKREEPSKKSDPPPQKSEPKSDPQPSKKNRDG